MARRRHSAPSAKLGVWVRRRAVVTLLLSRTALLKRLATGPENQGRVKPRGLDSSVLRHFLGAKQGRQIRQALNTVSFVRFDLQSLLPDFQAPAAAALSVDAFLNGSVTMIN